MCFLECFLVCLGLAFLFPSGFGCMAGAWVGFITGSFLWGLLALVFHGLVSPIGFVSFALSGFLLGIILSLRK